jgi:hypothetical protein
MALNDNLREDCSRSGPSYYTLPRFFSLVMLEAMAYIHTAYARVCISITKRVAAPQGRRAARLRSSSSSLTPISISHFFNRLPAVSMRPGISPAGSGPKPDAQDSDQSQ